MPPSSPVSADLSTPPRQRSYSGAPWEPLFGYCRAIRVGNVVEVSGTTAMKGNDIVGEGDAYLQTKYIIEIIGKALEELGASVEHIIRTRVYVTNVSDWKEIAKAHHETFAAILPTATLVEVSALIDPRQLVEIEVTAII